MDNELRHPLTELKAGSTLHLRDQQGYAVVVFEGQVWITQDGDARDIVLAGGESFRLDRPGLALVQAMHDSKLMLLQARPRLAALAPSSYALHQWAREQRSAAIGAAIGTAVAKGLAALHDATARPAKRPTSRPLTACTVVR